MIFEGTTGLYEHLYRFNSKWVRKKEKYANSKLIWRIFCLRSNRRFIIKYIFLIFRDCILIDCLNGPFARWRHYTTDNNDQNTLGFCFLVQIRSFVTLNLAGITKFKYEREDENDYGRSSEVTPSCKWLIFSFFHFEGSSIKFHS